MVTPSYPAGSFPHTHKLRLIFGPASLPQWQCVGSARARDYDIDGVARNMIHLPLRRGGRMRTCERHEGYAAAYGPRTTRWTLLFGRWLDRERVGPCLSFYLLDEAHTARVGGCDVIYCVSSEAPEQPISTYVCPDSVPMMTAISPCVAIEGSFRRRTKCDSVVVVLKALQEPRLTRHDAKEPVFSVLPKRGDNARLDIVQPRILASRSAVPH